MTPHTQAILSAVAKALDAKATTQPHYIRQPMLEVAETLIQQIKESTNGSSNHGRSRPYGIIRA